MGGNPAEPVVLSSQQFRGVLGHFATGVTIITALDDRTPVGFSCQSFQSLSLDPPLVTFAPQRTSASWPRIRKAGRFCANILADDQEEVCLRFASPGQDKFAGIGWRLSPSGCPVLDDVLAWVDCEIEQELDGGDHVLVLGRVLDLAVPRDGLPLLYFRGRFASLRPRPDPAAVEDAVGQPAPD